MPSGIVTFLFTDIEGSTALWEADPESMRGALKRHDMLVRDAIEKHEGYVFKTIGDAFCAAFSSPQCAVAAALACQMALIREEWETPRPIRARMALHAGMVEERDNDYFGTAVNRIARLLSIGHGGQVLLSMPVVELVRDTVPDGVRLEDKGEHRLKDLQRPENVFQLIHPALPYEFPLLKSLDNPGDRNNLPQSLTSFIGRERELAEITALASKSRLLTLTGPGGCGKTRLALQLAADNGGQCSEGVWLVELAQLVNAGLVPQAVAGVLGVQEESSKLLTQTLVEFVGAKPMLLLLDNCEHVLDSCCTLSEALLRNCPNVRIVATSRERLGIAGEITYGVRPLSLPGAGEIYDPGAVISCESVRLFTERALLQRPDFVITSGNASAVALLCIRLDGIPFAIELAAARIRSMSPREINSRLGDRFRLLTGNDRMAVPRQKTLRAMIDWSYELLSPDAKALLRQLSVFVGGWTIEAAEAVAMTPECAIDILTDLVDKSLVFVEPVDQNTRYRFLETTREYALNRLAESDEGAAAKERHENYFVALAESTSEKLRGTDQANWMRVLDQEYDNLRAAMDRDGSKLAYRIASALWWYWFVRGYFSEGRAYLERLGAQPDIEPKQRAGMLNAAGVLATSQGDYAAAAAMHEQCLQFRKELDDTQGMAHSFSNLGSIRFNLDDYVGAAELFDTALALYREVEDVSGVALTLNNLGATLINAGHFDRAADCFNESLAIHSNIGHAWKETAARFNLGVVAFKREDYTKAAGYVTQCLTSWHDLGDDGCVSECLFLMAQIAALQREDGRAAALFGASSIMRETANVALGAFDQREEIACHKELISRMGEQEFLRSWEMGRGMSTDTAVVCCLRAGSQ